MWVKKTKRNFIQGWWEYTKRKNPYQKLLVEWKVSVNEATLNRFVPLLIKTDVDEMSVPSRYVIPCGIKYIVVRMIFQTRLIQIRIVSEDLYSVHLEQ